MQMTSANGNKRLEIYQKMGAMFEDKKTDNDKAPDYSGPLDLIEGDLRIAGWKGQSEKGHYLSLKVSKNTVKKEEGASNDAPSSPSDLSPSLDDEVPF